MNLPFFYSPVIVSNGELLDMEEENAKHIVQVLRKKSGDELRLTDGKGTISLCVITASAKKSCTVRIQSTTTIPPPLHKVTIAISLLKNAGRFEWFLEKAAETGVHSVVPLICHRTERQVFRESRMKSILVSAMLQSQQSWITEITSPQPFQQYLSELYKINPGKKYIAHCTDTEKTELSSTINKDVHSSLILIGPEGDFTNDEIEAAIAAGCQPVALGATRLRSETAAITAAVLLKQLGA